MYDRRSQINSSAIFFMLKLKQMFQWFYDSVGNKLRYLIKMYIKRIKVDFTAKWTFPDPKNNEKQFGQ